MKELVSSMDWLSKAIVLALGFGVFPFVITSLAQKGIKSEVSIAWWMIGVPLGMIALSKSGGAGLVTDNTREFFNPLWAVILMVALGATLGTVLNTFYGQAIALSPNPALAMMFINAAMVLTYLLAPLLHKMSPGTFPSAQINWLGLCGILVTLTGIVMVAKASR